MENTTTNITNPINTSPQPASSNQMQEQPALQQRNTWKIVALLLSVLLVGMSGYIIYLLNTSNMRVSNQQQIQETSVSPTPTTVADPMVNWTQGSIKDAWQEISSPDLALKGSQEPKIGMSISIRVFDVGHPAEINDIVHTLGGAGVTGNYQVSKIQEDQNAKVQGKSAIIGEYLGTDPAYAWHFWSQAVAKDNNIILITITDFKEDKSLDSSTLAPQILSTFKLATLDNTANWQIYPPTTTIGLKYTFKYPPNITLQEAQDLAYFMNGNATLYHRFLGKQTDLEIALDNFKPWGTNEQVIFSNNKESVNFGEFNGYRLLSADGNNTFLFLKSIKLNGILVFHYPTVEFKSKTLLEQIIPTIRVIE